MNHSISIRSIPGQVWQALISLATQNNRTNEAEARNALQTYVQPQIESTNRSERCIIISARLNAILEQINRTQHSQKIKPSNIAEQIGEVNAQDAEDWFLGKAEPSFLQLEKIADLLGCDQSFLKHGERCMFPVQSKRIPRDAEEAITWLLDLDQNARVTRLHLIRDLEESGSLYIVKQYGDFRSKTFTTNLHISESVGSTGEADLAYLTVMMELLYEVHSKYHACWIQGHLIRKDKFRDLIDGHVHPLNFLKEHTSEAPWWEDFWGPESLKTKGYWEGWTQFCKRFNHSVEAYYPKLKAERDLIRSGEHPFMAKILAERSNEALK